MIEHIQSLSKEQERAVFSKRNILLTAIPGSGKTRSLINKLLFDYDPSILSKSIAITYTRRAANEIEYRLINQIGSVPKNIWVGTIHKFCLEFIIRSYGSYSEHFSNKFQIIGEQDQQNLINKLKNKHKVHSFDNIDFTLNINGKPNEKNNIE